MQLPLRQVLTLGVCYVNGAWSDQQRFAPVRELGDICCKGGNHCWQAVHLAKTQEAKFERKGNFNLISRGRQYVAPQFVRRPNQPVEQIRMRMIGDHIGRASAADKPDVQRAWTNFRIGWQWHIPQSLQCWNELVDSGLPQFWICRVGHTTPCA